MPRRHVWSLVKILFCAGAAMACLPGCGHGVASMLGPNQPPELEIVSARADRESGGGVRVRWAARDPDGRVARSRWTLSTWNPAGGRAGTSTTSASECVLPVDPQELLASGPASRSRVPELFELRAVDDRGAESAPATLALFGPNVAPTVRITGPVPSPFLATMVAPTPCITWTGQDLDGVFTQRPVKYKYTLLTDNTPVTRQQALANPDAIRQYYAPIAWAGWDSTSSDTTRSSTFPTSTAPASRSVPSPC